MRAIAAGKSSQPKTFATAFDPKNNGFGLLRLTLALLVIFAHAYPLGGFGLDPLAACTRQQQSIGEVAVAVFFALSGFLICRSAAGPLSVPRFLWHRVLRIYPAYWVCLLVCGFVFAPLFCLHQFGSFTKVFAIAEDSSLLFVADNAALFHLNDWTIPGILYLQHQTLGGLLAGSPYPYAINGSLWSLPFEVTCYVAVAALAAVGVLRGARSVVLALFGTLWALHVFRSVDPASFHTWFPAGGLDHLVTLSLFFSAGCICFLYREKIRHSTLLLVIALAALAGSLPLGLYGVVAPVAITYVFLWLAFALPFSWFEKKGDFSYGTYIYAFPVQQGLALLRIHEEGFVVFFFSAVLLTVVLAFFSYRLVEAPALRLKAVQLPKWRRPEQAAAAAVGAVTPSSPAADALA